MYLLPFCITLTSLSIELTNTDYGHKTKTKNKPPILYGRFKVICKNDDDLEGLLSSGKRFNVDIGMQFVLEKCTKITSKK